MFTILFTAGGYLNVCYPLPLTREMKYIYIRFYFFIVSGKEIYLQKNATTIIQVHLFKSKMSLHIYIFQILTLKELSLTYVKTCLKLSQIISKQNLTEHGF